MSGRGQILENGSEAGDGGLRDQLLENIERLAGAEFGPAEFRRAFPEVVEAFEPPGFALDLSAEHCAIEAEDGGAILIGGVLMAGAKPIGFVQRRLMVGFAYAIHETLVLWPRHRGRGISVVSLMRSFQFYDQIGLNKVLLKAGAETGRWHWARVGFDFVIAADREAVRKWFALAIERLGLDLRVDRFSSAAQFERIGGNRRVSFARLIQAFPRRRTQFERIAADNGLRLDDEIALGRGLMLTGPEWWGVLDLQGPGRLAFDAYAAAKIARLGL